MCVRDGQERESERAYADVCACHAEVWLVCKVLVRETSNITLTTVSVQVYLYAKPYPCTYREANLVAVVAKATPACEREAAEVGALALVVCDAHLVNHNRWVLLSASCTTLRAALWWRRQTDKRKRERARACCQSGHQKSKGRGLSTVSSRL